MIPPSASRETRNPTVIGRDQTYPPAVEAFADYTCPHCGESISAVCDPSGGAEQRYTEDCPVCCSPNVLTVHYDREGTLTLTVVAE